MAPRGAQIITWHSVSDRVMPGTRPALARSNYSTVANVQHMSALNGLWVIGATRSGIEHNPINGSPIDLNGGSSIWSPQGHKLVQAPMVPPDHLPPSLNGIFSTTIRPSDADDMRDSAMARRHPRCTTPYWPCCVHPSMSQLPQPQEASAWPCLPLPMAHRSSAPCSYTRCRVIPSCC